MFASCPDCWTVFPDTAKAVTGLTAGAASTKVAGEVKVKKKPPVLTEAMELPTEPPTEPPTEAIFLREAPIFLREAQVQKRLRLRSLSRDVRDPGRIAAPARVDEEEEQWMRHGVDLTADEAWS